MAGFTYHSHPPFCLLFHYLQCPEYIPGMQDPNPDFLVLAVFYTSELRGEFGEGFSVICVWVGLGIELDLLFFMDGKCPRQYNTKVLNQIPFLINHVISNELFAHR